LYPRPKEEGKDEQRAREWAHDFVVAMEAGDWEGANELVVQGVPLNKQWNSPFLAATATPF
jgi:hypothetical protein